MDWNKQDFIDCGFIDEAAQTESYHILSYQGDVLKYQMVVDEEIGYISISADTAAPFSPEAMYGITMPCAKVVFTAAQESQPFHFAFFSTEETTGQFLRLTVAGRSTDKELLIWPYPEGVSA